MKNWPLKYDFCKICDFENVIYICGKCDFVKCDFCEKCEFENAILVKIWLLKCDFCEKWDYENAISVKKCDFKTVNFAKNVIFLNNVNFLDKMRIFAPVWIFNTLDSTASWTFLINLFLTVESVRGCVVMSNNKKFCFSVVNTPFSVKFLASRSRTFWKNKIESFNLTRKTKLKNHQNWKLD